MTDTRVKTYVAHDANGTPVIALDYADRHFAGCGCFVTSDYALAVAHYKTLVHMQVVRIEDELQSLRNEMKQPTIQSWVEPTYEETSNTEVSATTEVK